VPRDGRGRVFISHIADEGGVAAWLKARLDADFLGGLDLFVSSDRATIDAGSRWLDEVERALKQADLQVLLCSRASVGRPWVNFEAGAVWLRGIPVVPVCHTGLTPDDLPVPLSMLQSVELSRPDGLAKLYDAVAETIGLRVPAVDFEAAAAEARALEERTARAPAIEVVEGPRVLCAASAQYAQPEYAFDLDVAVVERHFPGRVTVVRDLTSARLLDLLVRDRYDIVHLVCAVDRESGAIVFDPVDPVSRAPAPGSDLMMPAGFASLLRESSTRLVVLATCEALHLAVEAANIANMAASHKDISGAEAAAWEECFYRLVAGGTPVHKAFELTALQAPAPMQFVRHTDVAFALPAAPAAAAPGG
jgi:TIR domain-containing protein